MPGSDSGEDGGGPDGDPSDAWVDAGSPDDTVRLCVDDAECDGDSCIYASSGDARGFCGAVCADADDCPEGWDCRTTVNSGRDSVRACVPVTLCVDADQDGWGLGPGCLGADCDDFNPQVNPAGVEVCDGLDNDCDGRVDDAPVDVRQICSTGQPGVCSAGQTVCEEGNLRCVPDQAPGEERCDGMDNTCDGRVDVDPSGSPLVRSCYPGPAATQDVGVCRAGVEWCATGAWGSCTDLVLPTPEVCDGLDNNCNGTVDEGNPGAGLSCNSGLAGECAAGTTVCEDGAIGCRANSAGRPEICDGVDNDCDGEVDNGNPGGGGICSSGLLGVCAAGTRVCVGGTLQCEPVRSPSDEVCDGLDNNCDGRVDEGNPGGGEACESGQPGQCAAGQTLCTGGALACVPLRNPSAEVCDGVDNDCDGVIDNGSPGAGLACTTGELGICASGVTACDAGGVIGCRRVREPSAELCDGLDNNCDGQVDEGNPGGGGVCSTGFPGVCANGVRVCQSGTLVCNQTATASAEVCDGLDNNCNGQVDEGNPGGGGSCTTGQPGVCSPGTLNCQAGTLQCSRTVAPSSEVCDGLDNDCNGVVDNTCPRLDGGVTRTLGATTTQYGGTGGTAFSYDCPAGSLLVGLRIRAGSEIDAVTPRCRAYSVREGRGSIPYVYSMVWSPGSSTTQGGVQYGGSGGTEAVYDCPANQWISHYDIRAAARVDRLVLKCSSLSLVRVSSAWGISRVLGNTLAVAGGTGGTLYTNVSCPTDQVAQGIQGRSGSRLDAFAARCARLSVPSR
jgi:hypothetical protein